VGKKKNGKVNMDMLRSIGKQSRESGETVLKKKKKQIQICLNVKWQKTLTGGTLCTVHLSTADESQNIS